MNRKIGKATPNTAKYEYYWRYRNQRLGRLVASDCSRESVLKAIA
ncbi:hypothetical protein COO91_02005 [Nostoc flagelliforme CCNUN1]|uniref:Uncharacterized protein n=1 Tax=Nostoc flagelliforme CCNUN1 TaxID=2038116 RepID=A0A2K8SKV7_9NOSO|nr:hypothetical protein [Nostoc flagelliforme]AUB36104.1 hypothetical protein COO91_02005 [Nostoc flagelliforme CCNUN1]